MGAVSRIQNLETILKKYVGQHLHIEHTEEAPISKSSEALFKVDVKFTNGKKNLEETLHTVAKFSGDLQKELAFYNVVVPKLQNFQKQYGDKDLIHYFPKYYGGRLNRNENKDDGPNVLLIENVLVAGYEQKDRLEGFNFKESALILKNLAHFHAVSLAMKLKKPMEYGRHIREFCPVSRGPRGKLPSPDTLIDILYENNGCLPYISKMKVLMKNPSLTEIREPWGTLCHGNFWTPKITIKYEDKKPVESKFIDFQKYNYDSPLADLLKFVLTSVQLPVLEVFLDSLLQHYHDSFLHHITRLGIDSKDFEWTEFQNEMKAVSKSGVLEKLYFLIYVVHAKEGESLEETLAVGTRDVSLKVKEKVWFIVQEWGRRNWL